MHICIVPSSPTGRLSLEFSPSFTHTCIRRTPRTYADDTTDVQVVFSNDKCLKTDIYIHNFKAFCLQLLPGSLVPNHINRLVSLFVWNTCAFKPICWIYPSIERSHPPPYMPL